MTRTNIEKVVKFYELNLQKQLSKLKSTRQSERRCDFGVPSPLSMFYVGFGWTDHAPNKIMNLMLQNLQGTNREFSCFHFGFYKTRCKNVATPPSKISKHGKIRTVLFFLVCVNTLYSQSIIICALHIKERLYTETCRAHMRTYIQRHA